MTDEARAMAALIADGLDPAIVERVLTRAGHICRLRQRDEAKYLATGNCDVRWTSGYVGAWDDCAGLLACLAELVANPGRSDAAPRDQGRR